MDSVAAYSILASEYYDRELHPTCANFRSANRIFIVELMKRGDLHFVTSLELGAGDSVLAEVVAEYEPELISNIEITDASAQMLSHSAKWTRAGARARIVDASSLPYLDQQFDLVVGLAGDPYNTPRLWSEVHRVLRARGRFVFTQPSYAWAARFRQVSGSEAHTSEFVLRDGNYLQVPSNVLPKNDVRSSAGTVGLQEIYSRTVLTTEISGPISKKLTANDASIDGVIDGFVFEKM